MTHSIYAGLPENSRRLFRQNSNSTTPEDIIIAVCAVTDITRDQIVSPSRKREIVEARHIAIGLILQSFRNIGLKEVGRMFNRDHSTVIYARETYRDLMETDRDFRKKVALVKL
jgi:chromosomal replication initiator protein